MPTLKLGPFQGHFSAGPKHEAPPGYVTADSRDWAYSPRHGKWKRRSGSAIKGDTVAAGVEQSGILSGKWSAKGRQVLEMQTDSLVDGYATVMGLWTNETAIWGQLLFYNTNSSAWGNIRADFTLSGTYAGLGAIPASGVGRFRMVPIWSENPLTFSRCADAKQLRMPFAGTRQGIVAGNYFYAPSAQATPVRYNLRFPGGGVAQDAEVSATKIWPAGHMPPLVLPIITKPAATTVGDEPWKAEDRFIYTMAYRFEDGSIGRPFIPRPLTAVPLTAGSAPPQNQAGWVFSVGTLAGDAGKKYAYLTYTNIHDGPPGTVSKLIWRTPKTDQSNIPSVYAQVNGATVLQLGLVVEIPNNSTTTYVDYQGNDATLVVDPINCRFGDHKWPRRGRSMFSFDGHYAVGGALKPNPSAIIVGQNLGDDSYMHATVTSHVAVRNDQVRAAGYQVKVLLLSQDLNYPSTGILCDSSTSLLAVCDKILFSIAADTVYTRGAWGAQLVPGIDENATADNLEYTQVYANFTTTNNSPNITVTTRGDAGVGNVDFVKVGMLINQTFGGGAAIPNGCYVGSVNTTTKVIGMVDSAGAAKNATANATAALRIGWDFGDAFPGEARVFSCAYPFVAPFTKSYLDAKGTEERAIDFTGGDPGHAKNAANSWYVKNRRDVPNRAGRFMGAGEVEGGAVVYYSRGKAYFVNPRAGNTNLDDDWKLPYIAASRGAISPEVVQGNGCVFAWTAQGVEVADRTGARIISGTEYDATEKTGELAYEIAQCTIAARAGTDVGQGHLEVSGDRLRVSYRSSGSSSYCDRYIVYDFSQSGGIAGIAGALRDDGTPYGWSCPHRVKSGVMGEVQDGTGAHLYALVDSNAGTADGRVQEFETGTTDDGVAIVPIGYCSALLDEDEMWEFAPKEIRTRYKKNGTGLRVGLSRDRTRTGIDYLALPTSSTDDYGLQRMPTTENQSANKELIEAVFTDDGSGDGAEFARCNVIYEKVRNTQRR